MDPAEVLSRVVSTLGLPRLTRATIGRRRAAILLYHDPSPEVVDAHLTHLRRRHALVSLDELVEHLRAGTFDRLPERAVAITIDDGHRGNRDLLPMCDSDEAEAEIAGCRSEIEGWLDRPCLHFAYPNGDHSPREVDMVRRAGYRSGRTTAIGWVGPRSDPYRLPILGVPDDASVTRLEADLTGVTSWLAHHWGGGLPRPWRRG